MWVFIETLEPQYPETVICRNQEELESFIEMVSEENHDWSKQEITTLLTSLDNDSYRVGWFSVHIV